MDVRALMVPNDVRELMKAALKGDVYALAIALANLTSGVDCEGEYGDRPLHIACLFGHQSCVQILLAAGANIKVHDENGGIPLHDACAGGYEEIVRVLLGAASSQEQMKCVLDSYDDIDGDTPLHDAARGNHAQVVQLLLEKGANPKIANFAGQVRLNAAVEKLNAESAQASPECSKELRLMRMESGVYFLSLKEIRVLL